MTSMIALHGFLGLPSDWTLLQNDLTAFRWIKPDLYDQLSPKMTIWAENFNVWISKTTSSPRILMGYSLGGRLALHALFQNPFLWKGAVLFSTHPGLPTQEECHLRKKQDLQWAERFLIEPWGSLMNSWDAQPAFVKTTRQARAEEGFSRHALSEMLKRWSLGSQEDFTDKIENSSIPILWLTGQEDHKFTKLAENLRFRHCVSRHEIVPGSGHRIMWDQPQICSRLIKKFITKLEDEKYDLSSTYKSRLANSKDLSGY